MKVNVFGKLFEVIRKEGQWELYRLGEGKKSLVNDFVIPDHLNEEEVITYLADIFHEAAKPGASDVFRVDLVD